jgi:hypothetical protein
MPAAAYAFARAEWHYDPRDHRCPHDAWVERVVVDEVGSGSRSETRTITIEVTLLGAYHDGWIGLRYEGVRRYSLTNGGPPGSTGHGDRLIDEVRLTENDAVVHEVLFAGGGRWLIECADISHRWTPSDHAPERQAVRGTPR